jgi:putative tryptophan/tyrosine transport system substrate-binding protein
MTVSSEQKTVSSRNKRSEPIIRRINVCLLLTVLLFTVSPAEAQQSKKVYRIGVLSPGSPGPSPLLDAFRQGLRQLGYVEGQNIAIEYRFAEAKPEALPDLAAELVHLRVDVILTMNTPASEAAKNATKTTPIVFTYVADPAGLVASLARPGGNVTGLTTIATDLSGKRLEILKESVPKIRRVAALLNPANPVPVLIFKETDVAARALGLQLQSLEVRGPDELPNAFEVARKVRAGALLVIEDLVLSLHRARIVDLAVKSRLPTASQYREFAEAGGLLSYGANLPDSFRRAAYYVDKILKGTKPADLPVEQPTKFEFVINLKTAKQIGLTIPQSVLYRADKVIK